MSQAARAEALLLDVINRTDHPRIRATLAPLAADPTGFGERFYSRLFAQSPGLRTLFPADLHAQQLKLAQTLCVVVAGLDQPDALVPMLRTLGEAHRGFGVKGVHYLAVGEALVHTLAAMNGEAFDDEARAAWQRLYAWIAQQMYRHA